MDYLEMINESVKYIKAKIKSIPKIGLILGSGLGELADAIEDPISISYESIPNFPVSTVEGHRGQLVIGKLGGKEVIAMQGRFHFYEGYPLRDVTFPVRVMSGLGVETLLVTNAAGGANKEFEPGDLMVITDHINFAGDNPLIGENLNTKGPRFLDMTYAYDRELIELVKKVSEDIDLDLKEGVYMWFTGPTYETPAEVKLARVLGADAVGMSTVPEVIVANHEGLRVLGISCITNMASGILDKPLDHAEVVETSLKVREEFKKLLVETLKRI